MQILRSRSLLYAAVLTALTLAATPAVAATNYVQCHRDLVSGRDLVPCQSFDLNGSTAVTVQPDILDSRTVDGEEVLFRCRFQFWSYDGNWFPPDNLSTWLTPPDLGSRVATAWYNCTCDPELNPEGTCDGGPGGGVSMRAVDLNTGDFVASPWVESTDPANAMGSCATQALCSIAAGADAVTAEDTVEDSSFDSWMTGASDRTVSSPSGFLVALYKSDPCLKTDSPSIPRVCASLADLRRPLPTLERGWAPVDRICMYVSDGVGGVGDLKNCPGCGGPNVLCPNWKVILEGPVDAMQGFIVDRWSDKIVARATGRRGKLTLRFKPQSRGRLDSGRYALLLIPDTEASKAGPRLRVDPGGRTGVRPIKKVLSEDGIKVRIEVESPKR